MSTSSWMFGALLLFLGTAASAQTHTCPPQWHPRFNVDATLYPYAHQCFKTAVGMMHFLDEGPQDTAQRWFWYTEVEPGPLCFDRLSRRASHTAIASLRPTSSATGSPLARVRRLFLTLPALKPGFWSSSSWGWMCAA